MLSSKERLAIPEVTLPTLTRLEALRELLKKAESAPQPDLARDRITN